MVIFKSTQRSYILFVVMVFSAFMLSLACDFEFSMAVNRKLSRYHYFDQLALLNARSGLKLGKVLLGKGKLDYSTGRVALGRGELYVTVVPSGNLININSASRNTISQKLEEAGFKQVPDLVGEILKKRSDHGAIGSLRELSSVVGKDALKGNNDQKGLYEIFTVSRDRKKKYCVIKSSGIVNGINRCIIAYVGLIHRNVLFSDV